MFLEIVETIKHRYGVIAAGSVIIYLLAISIYNAYFHPLAKFPGPPLARVSRLWYIRQATQGQLPFSVAKCHRKYGSVVRIAPDELAFVDIEAWKDIYGHRSGKGEMLKDPMFYDFTSFGPNNSIINVPGERHGQLRRLLSYGFSEKALREQEPIIQGYLDLMIRRLRDESLEEKPIDMVKWYNFFTFDVIGDLAFGEPFGCLQTAKMHPWIDWTFDLIEMGTWRRSIGYYPLLNRLVLALLPKSLTSGMKMHKELMVSKARHRLNMKRDKVDFMTRMAAPDSGLTELEFIASADTVLLGGSETTATLLSGVTYYLVHNLDALDKLTKEIRSKFKSEQEITFEQVNTLPYILACIDEAFRLYPPVPGGLPRRTTAPEDIVGYEVPPNTTITIYHWAMNRNPDNFARVTDYIPERWLGDPRFAGDKRAAMRPFSVGPRNCIGQNLAYIEMRLALCRLLFNFDIEATPACKNWTKQQVFLLWKKKPLWIKLKPRDVELRQEVLSIKSL